METNTLVYQTSPKVTIATNTFVNVPIILKYEETNLIEIIKEVGLGFTTQIPIYHSDGTFLAKVKGNRIFLEKGGEKADIKIDKYHGLWVCKMNNKTLFEIHQQTGDSFKTTAELYTPEGYFVKCSNEPTPVLFDTKGTELKIGGMIMSGNLLIGCKIGVWLKRDGSISVGVNG
jgi:hypothetical protein